jgi:hypothetical protein
MIGWCRKPKRWSSTPRKLASVARKLRTDKRSRRAKFDAEDAISETDTVAGAGGNPVEAPAHAKVSEAVDQELPAADPYADLPPVVLPEQDEGAEPDLAVVEPAPEVALRENAELPVQAPTVCASEQPAIPDFLQRKRLEAANV